jgi:mono/diheme cytochrome c family protein
MRSSHWKTGSPKTRSERVTPPSAGQVLRQLGLVVLIVVVWGGAFAGYVSVAKPQIPTPAPTQFKSSVAIPRVTRTRPVLTATAIAATVTPVASATSPVPTIASAVGETRPAPTLAPAPATAAATPMPVLATPTNLPSTAGRPGTVSFSKDVLPIFTSVCVKCHGGEKTEQSLVLKTYADVMQGSDNGPVIEPGKSADSLLVDLINQGKMPKKGPRLLPAQIRIITQWVDEGALNN